MAQGDVTLFYAAIDYVFDRKVDVASGSWAVLLLTDSIATISAAEAAPAIGTYTECSAGGGYTTGGIAITLDPSKAVSNSGVYTLKVNTTSHPGGLFTWTAGAGSPEDIKTALVIDGAATSPVDAAWEAIDMTADGGTTPVSLVADNVTITFGSGGAAGDLSTATVTA